LHAGTATEALGAERVSAVEVFDERALIEVRCDGPLRVDVGSAQPPGLIKLCIDQPSQPADWRLIGGTTTDRRPVR
jgi:hypothetical protein